MGSILCQYMRLKRTNPRATVCSFYPSSHLPVLFSQVLLSLFVGYNFKMFLKTSVDSFVIECIHLFLSSNEPNILEGNIFYNGRVAEWEIKPNAAFNVLVAPALDILLLLFPGAALSRSPVFSFLILLVNVQLVCLRSYRIL